MSVTTPNYDFDFRQAISSNSTISDNISNITAIYGSNVSSTATNGLAVNGNGGTGVDDVTLPNNLSFSSSYSLEFYVRHNTNATYAGICRFKHDNNNDIIIDMYSTQRTLRFYMWSGGSVDFASHGDGTHDGTQMTIDGSTYHHMVCNYNHSTGQAEYYQDGTRVWYHTGISTDESDFPIVTSGLSAIGDINQEPDWNMKYFRIWTNHALSSSEVTTLYNNRDTTNYFSFSNLRVNYGDVYLAQTLNKTIEDYKNENIPLHDISFGAFTAINRLKETYIQGPVDISGDLVVRSNKNTFYDISASKIGFSSGYDYITVTDASYGVFASTTSSYTSTNIVDPVGTSSTSTRYGKSVDISRDGNYIIAGALNLGRAHVWKVDDMTVTHLGQLTNPIQNGRFGTVRITGDGSRAVVCDHNSVSYPQFTYIWSNPGSTTGSWSELTSARSGSNSYTFGWRVSMSQDGNVLIKGPSGTDNPISTFIWSTDQWISSGDIAARASGTYLLDNAINVDGTICVVGGKKYDSNNGYIAAYKYSKATTETDGTWEILGDYIDITETDGSTLLYWGTDVCINDAGDIVAATAKGDETNVTYDLIKAYKYSTPGVLGGTWTQLGNNIESSISNEGHAAQNLDMNSDGSIIAYGATTAGTNGGGVLVYQYSLDPQIAGGTWSQIALINRPTTSSNLTSWNFGTSVRLNGFGNKMHVGISPGGSTAGVGYTYLIDIDHTVDYRTTTTTVNPKIVTNDLSLNNRFFVAGDASFNGNVTIQGDLSFDSTISYTGTIENSVVNLGDTSIKTFTHDISLNADLAIHGKTTVKNDLYLNAYTDVSANPVLSDGTYLKNMKMDKLNHRYIMDISRSAPFSTLTSKTLPTDIWDSSSNSGICISADGKYIRTVNLSDISGNASSYYSNDYGNSFHKDEALSQNLSFCDISINTATQYSSDFKFGSDKVFMSYNGQHQLVPRGISNIGTYDDYLYTSNDFGKNWNLRKSSTLRTFNYTVTANGSSNYIFNGETYTNAAQPTVNIGPNESVVFTIDTTTNGNHPFKIGTSSSGGEITDSTISSVTSGSNQVITFTPTSSGTFYYYCSAHTGMGNSITVANYNMGPFHTNSWFWNTGAVSADGKNMYVSGSTGFWKSSDYGRVWNQTSADSSFNYMSISADGKLVYGVNERKVYGSTDYGNTFSTLYTDAYTSDSSYCGISTSGNGKYLTIADKIGSNVYMSSNYGNSFELKSLPSDDYTNQIGIPTPAYDWDFRQVASTGVNSNINGETLTYQGGLTSDATNGASFTASSSEYMYIENISIPAAFSFEMYYYLPTTVNESIIATIWAPTSVTTSAPTGTKTDYFNFGHSYWYENNQQNSAWRDSGVVDGTYGVNGWIQGNVLADNTWYHRVIVFNGSTWTVYQNGVLAGQKTHAHNAMNYNLAIMANEDGNLVGSDYKWSHVRIYNSALTADQITTLYNQRDVSTIGLSGPAANSSINCGMSHSGKIILNSNYISYNYGNNFTYVRDLISNQLTNNDTFYSKANLEYIIDASNNSLLQIPYKSAIFQDIYSVGSIKAGSTTYSSDYRLKENVQPLTENETVNELHPVKYYNTNLKKNDYGLLAHELQEKYPFLVSGEKDGAEKQSINYNGLISLLVHEVKNLKKEYQELVEMKNNA